MATKNAGAADAPTPGTKAETEAAVGTLPLAGNTDSEAAPAAPDEAEAVVERPAMRDLQGVEYIGTADVKIFTVADLAQVGVSAKGDLSWSAENSRTIDPSLVNAETADWLAQQEDFRVF